MMTSMYRQYLIAFIYRCMFVFLLGIHSANSAVSYDKFWSVAIVTGSIPDSTTVKYYLEPQIRLINGPHVFNQLLLLGGLGYQFNTKMSLFFGPGWIVTKTQLGDVVDENRFWQQLNWLVLDKPSMTINSRTRLEEREISGVSQMAVRFRQRVWIRRPFEHWEGYAFSCFDELFFNLNHGPMVSSSFFEQNRAFVGVAKQLSNSTLLDVGYLNQFIYSFRNELNHVVMLSFTVNW